MKMDKKSTSMSTRRLERTAAMPSVTVEMVAIAVTGSARHVATQWAMREGGAGRQQAGGSAWLRQKSHRRNFDD